MDATDTKVRFQLSIPGDDGHVAHRVKEAIDALMRNGFRLEAKLGGTAQTYLFADHEDAVDSSTVDHPAWGDQIGEALGIVLPKGDPHATHPGAECGHPVCGHLYANHRETDGKCTVEIVAGQAWCRCPGFMPVTRGEGVPGA